MNQMGWGCKLISFSLYRAKKVSASCVMNTSVHNIQTCFCWNINLILEQCTVFVLLLMTGMLSIFSHISSSSSSPIPSMGERQARVSVNTASSTLVHALMECRCTSCILRAFRMCGTCKLTASPPLPRIWFCSEDIDPRSVEPTCPVCLKSVGWPIIDRSIRGRLLCSCSCSATQENNWNQNSPAMIRSESFVRLNDERAVWQSE